MVKRLESRGVGGTQAIALTLIARPQFSIRTLLATAILAGLCYYWIEMPRATARRFVDAIRAEDFSVADRMFRGVDDRVLAKSNQKYWGFRADAVILPWDIGQFLSGRRDVRLHATYFFLDEHHDLQQEIAATAFGLDSPTGLSAYRGAVIDRTQMSGRVMEQR
jgi:hypothetical protein